MTLSSAYATTAGNIGPTQDKVNLVLVYLPGALDVGDYKRIALRVREVDPGIDVFILQDRAAERAVVERLERHRTFVFSPMQLQAFTVARGCVHAGRPMLKSEQLLRLELAGVPVPAWSLLDRGKRFDPQVWGEHVVVKPEISSGARDVVIVSTRELNERCAAMPQYARGGNNTVVQRLVRNPEFGKIRIQTLFDEILFARLFRFPEPVRFDSAAGLETYQGLFLTERSRAEDFDSPAVFELARRAQRCFDDVPMLALDVLVDERGDPWFIEANPGGNTWHFSSALVGRMLRERGTFLERQFGAFERAGEVLAWRARRDAL